MIWIHLCLFLEKVHPNPKFNLNVGGISNQILQLLPSYEKIRNLKISIVTKYSEYNPISNRLKTYDIHKFNKYKLDTIYFLIKSFFKIMKIHKKEPINVLNIHTYSNIIISPLIVRLIYKIPILMKIPIDFKSHLRGISLLKHQKIRSKIINYSWFMFFKRFIIKKINFLRPINNKMYEDLIELKLPKEFILEVPNGINSKKFIGLQKDEHKGTNFGYVGRLTEFKNLRFLLEVFKFYIAKYPFDKLFIYGKGSEENFILKFVSNNRLSNNIFLCGFEKEKTKIYSKLDVLIDPALAQGISNAILEAMCTETFVIASNVSGNRDLIKNGVTGLLFNPYKKEDLLKKLLYYKENKDLVQKVIINAKTEILLNYDIDIVTRRIYNFLKSKL